MVLDWIIAGATASLVALKPRSWRATWAATGVALAGSFPGTASTFGPAATAVAPTAALLSVAVGVAVLAVRLGAARAAASQMAALSGGSGRRLFILVCLVAAVLTAVVTLDGAVVIMAPIILELRSRFGTPLRPLLLGVVAVSNASSLALPEGNPTNLVVIERLGLPLGTAALTMLPLGVVAALLCSLAVGWRERRALGAPFDRPVSTRRAEPIGPGLLGVARVLLQITILLAVLLPLGRPALSGNGLPALLAVAVSVAVLAALTNNLPASAVVASGLTAGPAAYAALVGLSVGALATPRGSVATLIAGELTGERPHARVLLPVALAAALAATLVLWLLTFS